ncbi:MAG: hypothetical protein KDB61_15340, partial [Planctomycetes bacterium]|nr:hypothetical protein [Planctomycetota bacterium]
GLREADLTPAAQNFLAEARHTRLVSRLEWEPALEVLGEMGAAHREVTPIDVHSKIRLAALLAEDRLHAGQAVQAAHDWAALICELSAADTDWANPRMSSLQLGLRAWLQLARARVLSDQPVEGALEEAQALMKTLRSRYLREPGAQLILVEAEQDLGLCLWFGPEEGRARALDHWNQAAMDLQAILDRGSAWPRLRLLLAEIHGLRAQALKEYESRHPANQALASAQDQLALLPPSAQEHPEVLAARKKWDRLHYAWKGEMPK